MTTKDFFQDDAPENVLAWHWQGCVWIFSCLWKELLMLFVISKVNDYFMTMNLSRQHNVMVPTFVQYMNILCQFWWECWAGWNVRSPQTVPRQPDSCRGWWEDGIYSCTGSSWWQAGREERYTAVHDCYGDWLEGKRDIQLHRIIMVTSWKGREIYSCTDRHGDRLKGKRDIFCTGSSRWQVEREDSCTGSSWLIAEREKIYSW